MSKEFATPFEEYLSETHQSFKGFGDRMNPPKPAETVRRWASGISEPRKDERPQIELASNGAVKFEAQFTYSMPAADQCAADSLKT